MAREKSNLHIEFPADWTQAIMEYANELIDDEFVVERETLPHVTIKYGIETDDVNEVAEALGTFKPIRIMFGATKMFMSTDDRPTDVVKIDVFGESLRRLRRRIEAGLRTTDIYITYNPHVTLAYVKEFAALQYVGSNPFIEQKVILDRVVFSPVNGGKKIITCQGEILDYE